MFPSPRTVQGHVVSTVPYKLSTQCLTFGRTNGLFVGKFP